MDFKLTYATMFDPPPEIHQLFEASLAEVESHTGDRYSLYIDGRDVPGAGHFSKCSPIDERLLLGDFAAASLQ